MTESEIKKKCVNIVNYFLWTQFFGLDIKNRNKHSTCTLFDLSARTITAYIHQKPKLYIELYDLRYPSWPDEKLNIRYLLLLSSTFRQAVTRQEVQFKKNPRQFYWQIPHECGGIGLHILKKLLAGDRANTSVGKKEYVLDFFQWLDMPVMCKHRVWELRNW